MNYLANPMNIEYKYQFCQNRDGHPSVNQEAADPSMVLFQGRYFVYPSMTCGFWWSDDMQDWHFFATKTCRLTTMRQMCGWWAIGSIFVRPATSTAFFTARKTPFRTNTNAEMAHFHHAHQPEPCV